MNRILFETSEISGGVADFGGARARHVVEILHGEVAQIIKTGEIDGPVGTSRIESVEKTGDGYFIRAKIEHNGIALPPWVDLILAPPRPRVLKRLLPQLVSMGVGRIFLGGAK